jgi:hypothetical protein
MTLPTAKNPFPGYPEACGSVLGSRKFRMDPLADLAPQLRPEGTLIKADVRDAYHHLRRRVCDRDKLRFRGFGPCTESNYQVHHPNQEVRGN